MRNDKIYGLARMCIFKTELLLTVFQKFLDFIFYVGQIRGPFYAYWT